MNIKNPNMVWYLYALDQFVYDKKYKNSKPEKYSNLPEKWKNLKKCILYKKKNYQVGSWSELMSIDHTNAR